MLSIEKCKTILVDDDETYTDDEVKTIRKHLYKMARIFVESKNSISDEK